MPLPIVPLAPYGVFSASTVSMLEKAIHSTLGAVCLAAPADKALHAIANRYTLAHGELWFCSYDVPVTIRFAETDYLRVQFHHAGLGTTQIGHGLHRIEPAQGCVSAADAALSFGVGYQQLVWRIGRAALSRKLAAITGKHVAANIEFSPSLDLSLPRARVLLGLLHSAVHAIACGEANEFLIAELEQAMMVSLLSHAEHDHSRLLTTKSPTAAPWQVRRVEEYIEAHLDRPFRLEDAIQLVGCSARTLYRTFRAYRGYSPGEFSKSRRLAKAQILLGRHDQPLSVAQVAEVCGFNDLSHFARDYARAFGETPSATRRGPANGSRRLTAGPDRRPSQVSKNSR
jgi:AraC-like DNA-binding protein